MLSTYKALLQNNCLQWLDETPPPLNHVMVTVHVTILDESLVEKLELPGPKAANRQPITNNEAPNLRDYLTWQSESQLVKNDKLLGLFADDADLIDQITESAMQTRQNQPLRYYHENE